jgi:hypothetical protein
VIAAADITHAVARTARRASRPVRLALALAALGLGAGCALFGDGGCNDGSIAGSEPGLRYLKICGHVLEIDDATDRARYVGSPADAGFRAAVRLPADDLDDLVAGEHREPRPLAWSDLRIAAGSPGVFVLSWPAPSRSVAVPVGVAGQSLGAIIPGAFAAGNGLQLCGTVSGPIEIEIWQVRYPNPGGPSRLQTTLTGLARCDSYTRETLSPWFN